MSTETGAIEQPKSVARPRRKSVSLAHRVEVALTYLGVYAGAFLVLLPFIWMVCGSFKTEGDFFKYPNSLLPPSPTLNAYFDVWQAIPFARFFANSLIFAGAVTAISLFFDSLAAYALARLEFRGKKLAFGIVLLVLMVPFQITLIPLFLTVNSLGLINTFPGLILPRVTNAFGIFFLRQFFIGLPKELEDAARVDGANDWHIYAHVIMPLSKTALSTLAIFHFMANWNDLLWPLVMTTATEMRTLPAGLALFMGQYVIEHPLLMAGATITILPLTIAFLASQRSFVRGIAITGFK